MGPTTSTESNPKGARPKLQQHYNCSSSWNVEGKKKNLFAPFRLLLIATADDMNGLLNQWCRISPLRQSTIFHECWCDEDRRLPETLLKVLLRHKWWLLQLVIPFKPFLYLFKVKHWSRSSPGVAHHLLLLVHAEKSSKHSSFSLLWLGFFRPGTAATATPRRQAVACHLGPLLAHWWIIAIQCLSVEHTPCSNIYRALDPIQAFHVDLMDCWNAK